MQRYRDVLKSASVRNMVYDALQYAAQVEEVARSHRKARKEGDLEELEKKLAASEYLSGFYREDRLIPVITLVMYFSPGEWDGPMSLHEMLAVQDPEILSFVSDYRLNVIAPGNMSDEEIDQFSTSLREVMLFIKYSKDKAKLHEMVQKDDRFKNVDRKAVKVISTVTGIKFKVKKEEEKVDMCEGMRGLLEDATNEGVQQGIQQGIQQIALRMLKADCFSMEMIAQMTGLSVQEILALQL